MNPTPAEIVARLSVEQLAELVSGADDWRTRAFPELGLPSAELSDGPHGLRTETGVDMVWIPSTAFPTGSALGATWDPELVARVGVALGEEAAALGVQLVLGPGVNLKRTPLCGRNFEYFSEDPVLSGALAAAYITGVQSQGVGTCLKHFAANNQETERMRISVEADERTLRELYLEVFRRTLAASDPWALMCSYNRIGGTYASEHRWLLTDVLRGDWGYRGLVVSDWDAVRDPVASLEAGIDLEMPGTDGRSADAILAAIAAGELDPEYLRRAATRVVEFVVRAMPNRQPAASPVRAAGITPSAPLTPAQKAAMRADEHHELAREAAAAAITLLRNEHDLLPLAAADERRIAVVGAYAKTPRIQGGGSSGVDPLTVDEPLAALREFAGDKVTYAQGYPAVRTNYYQEFEAEGCNDAAALRAEAVAVAADADVIVAFVGLPLRWEEEAADRATLELPGDQVELLWDLGATGKPLVVVIAAGSAVTMDGWHDSADAILFSWLGGQGVGTAVARVLFGQVDPSGRLGESFPMELRDTPGYDTFPGADGEVHYDEGPFIGYRWYDARQRAVRYPFGHGLSYTSFAYEDAAVVASDGQRVSLAVTITNTGARAGAEVVQLYVQPTDAGAVRPPRELRGFRKVHLEPGESSVVGFQLDLRDFAVADVETQSWHQPEGTYQVVFASSAQAPRCVLELHRDDDRRPFREDVRPRP